MKTLPFFLLLILALTLSACSGQATPEPVIGSADTYISPNLDLDYTGALPVRNQLTLGILELDGTAQAITSEQAAILLPLWQALLGTQNSGSAAQAEVSALLAQIESSLTPAQLDAISALQLTQTDLQDWAASSGIALGSGSGQPGQGQGLSPEARATRQAEEGRTPGTNTGGGASTALLNAVIAYLEALVP
ncbi:MAG: hypothetical protein MUC85_11250 [Anaerolineales bacterium]|jgi:hypothetical protein|nr:hypothetical protein [Anaerolineales bacterium]